MKTFKIKHRGKTLTVRRQERNESIGVKSLQLLNGVSLTDAELRHCGRFQPSNCAGDPISMFDQNRLYVEVLSVWYPGESTYEMSETQREKRQLIPRSRY